MKIYVDSELPKNCGECPFNYDSVGCEVFEPKTGEDGDELRRCLDAMYGDLVKDAITDRRFSKCPLETTQSLKQQVREEVVEEIRKQLKNMDFLANDTEFGERFSCYSKYKVLDILLKVERNQVKGENMVEKDGE